MRVLHVLTRAHRRGGETFGVQLHEALLSRGLDSSIVALAPAPPGQEALDLPTLGATPRSGASMLGVRRRAGGADVVVAHGSDTLLACRLALLGSPIPFVYVNIGDPLHWASTRARRVRVRWMMNGAAAVGAIAPSAVDRLVTHLGLSPDKVRFTGNGRDPAHFRPADQAGRDKARRALGLPLLAPVAVAVAALSEEKRLDVAIDAIGSLPEWHLVVAGDGPRAETLSARAAAAAPGRVHLLGSVADVRPALAASDVSVLTSTTEGLPGALIEAAMCGLPLVGTDVGFVRDLIEDGRTGRLVAVGSPAATAAALVECLGHRAPWGQQARDLAAGRFASEQVVDRWLEILTSVNMTTMPS